MKDALNLIFEDHQRIRDLIYKFEVAHQANPEDCNPLIKKILVGVEMHAAMEEEIFYPAVAEHGGPELKKTIEDAHEAHGVVQSVIEELKEAIEEKDDEFFPKFEMLIENICKHFDEEERIVFPFVLANMKDELPGLLPRMNDVRKEFLAICAN